MATYDFSHFRLNNYSELDVYLKSPEANKFKAYLGLIYRDLSKLPPGSSINLIKDVDPNSIQIFIKIVCLFIAEGNPDYVFSEDYTEIRRLNSCTSDSIKNILEKISRKKNIKKDELDKAKATNNKTSR